MPPTSPAVFVAVTTNSLSFNAAHPLPQLTDTAVPCCVGLVGDMLNYYIIYYNYLVLLIISVCLFYIIFYTTYSVFYELFNKLNT